MVYLREMTTMEGWAGALSACILLVGGVLGGCSSSSQAPQDGGDGSSDSSLMCTYPAGGGPGDGGTFNSVCPTGGCPTGKVCVVEVGGVAGGGGEYCAPIPNECHGTPTCACMGGCVCTSTFGGRPETCTALNGSIACDNGIR
jgi:hypothetical protein